MERWPDAVRAVITDRHKMENVRDLLVGKQNGIKTWLTVE